MLRNECAKGLSWLRAQCEIESYKNIISHHNSGQVVLSEGVPELNWPNVPQAKLCLATPELLMHIKDRPSRLRLRWSFA